MKQIHALSLPVMLMAVATPADAQMQQQTKRLTQGAGTMEVTRNSDMRTIEGPAAWFTGKVTIAGQFQRNEPSRVSGAIVHFEPGARTAWHKHPLGQTLIVTEGVGWTQVEVRRIRGIGMVRHPPRR
jgi:hypothetical protein